MTITPELVLHSAGLLGGGLVCYVKIIDRLARIETHIMDCPHHPGGNLKSRVRRFIGGAGVALFVICNSALILAGCAPLIQTGGSQNVITMPDGAQPSTIAPQDVSALTNTATPLAVIKAPQTGVQRAPVIIAQRQATVSTAGDNARQISKPENSETLPESTLVVWGKQVGKIAAVVLVLLVVGMIFFCAFTKTSLPELIKRIIIGV
jgi:hypothetical protein